MVTKVITLEPEISGPNLLSILGIANRVAGVALRLFHDDMSGRTGGYLTVAFPDRERPPILMAQLYNIDPMKCQRCSYLTIEKVMRLIAHPEHATSFESRDPTAFLGMHGEDRDAPWGKWGGAISGKDYIFSFSGFPELIDEAVMFVTSIRLHQCSEELVFMLIDEGRNPYLRPLLNATTWNH